MNEIEEKGAFPKIGADVIFLMVSSGFMISRKNYIRVSCDFERDLEIIFHIGIT